MPLILSAPRSGWRGWEIYPCG